LPSNTALEPTPLCGNKIGPILKAGIGPLAFPIYWAARLSARLLDDNPLSLY
jgi:hypothetical protein